MSDVDPRSEDSSSFLEKERARLRKDFQAIQTFIFQKEEAGELTRKQSSEIDGLCLKVLADAGISRLGSSAIDVAVLRQCNHIAREELKRQFPLYAKEIDGLDSSPTR
jgi:hypothetical protein